MSYLRSFGILRSALQFIPTARQLGTSSIFSRSILMPTSYATSPLLSRSFSRSAVSETSTNLRSELQKEIEAEKQMEQEQLRGQPAPSMPGFDIENDEACVKLTKMHNNEKITILFNVNHSVDYDRDDLYEDDHQQSPPKNEFKEDSSTPVAQPAFSIEIEKGNDRLVFHLELIESHDEHGKYDFRVEEFYIAPVGDSEIDPKVYSSSGKYIDEKLHELLFMQFLEERGFDARFCDNLVNFATHYEHAQYVLLLEKIKTFITK